MMDIDNVVEGFVDIDGSGFYAIPAVDRMPPFLMSIVSDSDHWMFISSRGGLTAGRGDATKALFTYQTDDRLHHVGGITGSASAIRVGDGPWQPFARLIPEDVSRNLYKSVVGDEVIFEEIHHGLGLRFRYRWSTSDRFGFVRTSSLTNLGDLAISVEVIDGIVDLLPPGLEPSLYQSMSNLTNAYKRSELIDSELRLAAYTLESRISDRPEPAESLRATVAWCVAGQTAAVTVAAEAVDALLLGNPVPIAGKATGRPGAYLLSDSVEIPPEQTRSWRIVADVDQSQSRVAELRRDLRTSPDPGAEVTESVLQGTRRLVTRMAGSDALQQTGDRAASAHHFSNVLYNVMRGGSFADGYGVEKDDFVAFLSSRNRAVAARHAGRLEHVPPWTDRRELLALAEASEDSQLVRLTLEYLPLSFSRRHGDPSRPWNTFSIRVRDPHGAMIRYYEGNWRDIFQNWEALCLSYPQYLPNVISVFVNGSTIDGFNPYRVTRNGIDWEVPEPDNPWSNIGYWGDHQIVYLLRLLEMSQRYLPGELDRYLERAWFAYADVPYRIVPYVDIKRNPKRTIEYDAPADKQIMDRVASDGGDGRLLHADGDVYLVNLMEKLLVPALSKLSNFVPGGGIWMNTQRPEWNDGNNALVGNGLSMVTLYYLRRYLQHLANLVAGAGVDVVDVSAEVGEWLDETVAILRDHPPDQHYGDSLARQEVMDLLGQAFADYRSAVYRSGFSGKKPLALADVVDLCRVGLAHLDATILSSRGEDGLFHSYNLLRITGDEGAEVSHLYEMLEGQVAIISAGVLSAREVAEVVEALLDSPMWRPDQQSLMLYPAKILPSFLDKNIVPEAETRSSPLLRALLDEGDTSLVLRDVDGKCRFNSKFTNRTDVEGALAALAATEPWRDLVQSDGEDVVRIYENVFRHHQFTGRSGAMYAYEGIGSIYWHMVAKLLVAIQEAVLEAHRSVVPSEDLHRLVACYRRVRSGLGFNKTAAEYGAFPTDPYSHTPAHAGAQQPGMTGQVKEEVITRAGELGVRVVDGTLGFEPLLLRPSEFFPVTATWRVHHVAGDEEELTLPPGSLGFTVCGVPVVYRLTRAEPTVSWIPAGGQSSTLSGSRLDPEVSRQVLGRTGDVRRIEVAFPESMLNREGS